MIGSWAELLEAWLALTSVKYHDNLLTSDAYSLMRHRRPNFEGLCELAEYTRTAKWNLLVLYIDYHG